MQIMRYFLSIILKNKLLAAAYVVVVWPLMVLFLFDILRASLAEADVRIQVGAKILYVIWSAASFLIGLLMLGVYYYSHRKQKTQAPHLKVFMVACSASLVLSLLLMLLLVFGSDFLCGRGYDECPRWG
jgi:predicted histidine transporter YuiF (NhaC family)